MLPFEKQSYEQLAHATSHFLNFEEVENEIERKIETLSRDLQLQAPQNGRDHKEILTDYLTVNNKDEAKNRLRFLLSITGGSYERFQRLYEAEWPDRRVDNFWRDAETLTAIVGLLLGEQSIKTDLPRFVKRFFLLPADWMDRLQDPILTSSLVAAKQISQYSVSVGNALEKAFRDIVVSIVPHHAKGKVRLVDNKEVDIAIPNTDEPEIMIMCSYNLTTASGQSARANEQFGMYENIQRHNRLTRTNGGKAAILINVLDGGGWLSRHKDHRRMYESCDYCFAHSQLGEFRKLIQHWHQNR